MNHRIRALALTSAAFLFCLAGAARGGNSGSVRSLMDSVSIETLTHHVATLQYAGGHGSRVTFTPGNDSAAVYIRHAFDALPHLTTVQNDLFFIPSANPPFNTKVLMNIVATLAGKVDASKVIVIGAHFDCSASRMAGWTSRWDTIRAPGADDNATGVASLLEAARVLSDPSSGFTNDYTIRFIAFGAEEGGPALGGAGHSGSVHWVEAAKSRVENVIGMIDVDMIGYNEGHLFQSVVSNPASAWLSDKFKAVNDSSLVGLTLDLTARPNDSYSDHFSFWLAGYPAVCLIEYAWPWNTSPMYQPNPVYHSSFDTLGTVNMELVKRVTQMTIGVVASLAGTVTGVVRENGAVNVPEIFSLYQNYPNPFNPATTISYRLPASSRVSLAVYDLLGRELDRPVDDRQNAGDHSVTFDGEGLSSGVYLYRLTAIPDGSPMVTQTRRMVLVK